MKNLLLGLVMISLNFTSTACDVCGCAINAGSGDIIPGIYHNFIGIRTNVRHFRSEHLPLFDGEIPLQTREWFNTTELHGRYVPHKRIHLQAFIPYNNTFKEEEEETHLTGGFGDARLRTNFLLVDKTKDEKNTFFNLFLGTTLKMPTGRYDYKNQQESALFHRNMLPGTGTWDFGFSTDIIYRKQKMGAMLNANYLFRGTNDANYQFGNLTVIQAGGFYKKDFKNSSLLLELGLTYMYLEPDVDLRWNEVQYYAQGEMLAPHFRANYFVGDWSFQFAANKAAFQNMALGQIHQQYQFEVGIIKFIKNKS